MYYDLLHTFDVINHLFLNGPVSSIYHQEIDIMEIKKEAILPLMQTSNFVGMETDKHWRVVNQNSRIYFS